MTLALALAAALVAASAPGGPPAALPEEREAPPFIYIGVNSGANALKYEARRNRIREKCLADYRKDPRVEMHFFVGEPDEFQPEVLNKQGRQATARERGAAERLMRESDEHNDMVIVPARDEYRDKTGKVLDILRRGADSGAKYVVKLDDDMCLNLAEVIPLLEQHSANSKNELYMGRYQFKGTEFKVMAGPHNYTVPFMGGATYLVSAQLARLISSPEYDLTHSGLYELYGTSSEDANMGRFVAYAAKKHNVHVDYLAKRSISIPVDGRDDGTETFPNSHETKATKSPAGVPETAPGWTDDVTPFWTEHIATVDAGALPCDGSNCKGSAAAMLKVPAPAASAPVQAPPPAVAPAAAKARLAAPAEGDPVKARLSDIGGMIAQIKAHTQGQEAQGRGAELRMRHAEGPVEGLPRELRVDGGPAVEAVSKSLGRWGAAMNRGH